MTVILKDLIYKVQLKGIIDIIIIVVVIIMMRLNLKKMSKKGKRKLDSQIKVKMKMKKIIQEITNQGKKINSTRIIQITVKEIINIKETIVLKVILQIYQEIVVEKV